MMFSEQEALQLLKSGRSHDFKILCEDKTFPAHKLILAAKSPYFNNQLYGPDFGDNTEGITIEHSIVSAVAVLLCCLYTGRVSCEPGALSLAYVNKIFPFAKTYAKEAFRRIDQSDAGNNAANGHEILVKVAFLTFVRAYELADHLQFNNAKIYLADHILKAMKMYCIDQDGLTDAMSNDGDTVNMASLVYEYTRENDLELRNTMTTVLLVDLDDIAQRDEEESEDLLALVRGYDPQATLIAQEMTKRLFAKYVCTCNNIKGAPKEEESKG